MLARVSERADVARGRLVEGASVPSVRPKRVRVRVGDIFTIPVDAEHVAFGQVVAKHGNALYFAIFRHLHPRAEPPPPRAVLEDEIVFLGESLDAKLWWGDWEIVGHSDVDPDSMPLPAYKEGRYPPGTFDVVDYSGKRRRRASAKEVEELPFRTTYAPIRFEKALKALHGLEPWRDDYDKLFVAPQNRQWRQVFRPDQG